MRVLGTTRLVQVVLAVTLVSSAVLWEPARAWATLPPDLFTMRFGEFGSGVFGPTVVAPGDMLDAQWHGDNNFMMGIPEFPPPEQFGPAVGPWWDGVFLSQDSTWDSADRLLGTVRHDGTVWAGQTYQNEGTFQIPLDTPPGTYRVIMYVDYDAGHPSGVIAEMSETNNWEDCYLALTVTPEPSSFILFGIAAIALFGAWPKKRHATRPAAARPGARRAAEASTAALHC